MSRRGRLIIFLPAAAALVAGLVWGVTGLHHFGHYSGVYGLVLGHVAVPERRATSVVASVTFDYRGIDTLGEEFILFAAAVGCAILLRAQRGEDEVEAAGERAAQRADEMRRPVRALGAALAAPTVVLGAYIVTHGQLTPGGGFAGGVILSAAAVLVYTAGQAVAFKRTTPEPLLELLDGLGAAAFALVALGGLVFASAALYNFLPLGQQGDIFSGGTIFVLQICTGIEVFGGVTLIVSEFLDQTLLRRRQEA